METFQVMTILVQHDVLIVSFSDEVRDDDKKKVMLKLCQHIFMFNPKSVHVIFEHTSLTETMNWFLGYGFVKDYTDKDCCTVKINPDVLVNNYVKGFIVNPYIDNESQVIWRAKL